MRPLALLPSSPEPASATDQVRHTRRSVRGRLSRLMFTLWRERAGLLGRLIVMAEPYLRFLLAVASAAAAGLLAACGSPQAQTPSPGSPSSGGPTVSPAPRTPIGLVPAPRGLTDRLVLRQTRVTAGTPIKGMLVVTYRGHAPINLNRGCRPR